MSESSGSGSVSGEGDQPRSHSDEEIVETIEHLLEDGRADLANGGIPTALLSEVLGYGRNKTRERVRDLHDAGELERVDGVNPETLAPRKSYLPPSRD